MKTTLQDGIYQVSTKYFTAGLIIQSGEVKACAPILRKKLSYWLSIAVRVADLPDSQKLNT